MKNRNLNKAKSAKNDEFYTQISDIENELRHYQGHFKDKVVYCNCDDHRWSNFFRYFSLNFEFLGLKKLITTHFSETGDAHSLIITKGTDVNGDGRIDGLDAVESKLSGNGDFRSPEAIEFLKEADIVVSNPPFSLFREYIALMAEYDKKFLVIGNMNAITYKDCFKLIKEGKMWLGVNANTTMEFQLPPTYEKYSRIDANGNKYGKVPAICWFTNLNHNKRNEELILFRKYNEQDYPKYDNYDAIECSKTVNIPMDYYKVIGVPISFLTKYNPKQFEIVDLNPHFFSQVEQGLSKPKQLKIKGQKDPYARILIKRKIND